jgi:outer membrane lipoprotein-sorting protein
LGFLVAACAKSHVALPTDTGVPLPDFKTIHMQLSAACTGVRTLTVEIGMSGRAGRQKLRGRVVAGFARPASMRLEGVAPFGPPAFILVARGQNATLLLPRDEPRVVRGAPPEDILGALTGVALGPADLQAILTGCVVPAPQPTDSRRHANGWASIDLSGGTTLYLAPAGSGGTSSGPPWQLRAATRAGWQIEYPSWSGSFPQIVRLQSTQPGVNVDLTATLSQVETNKDLEDAAFNVTVPTEADPITIDELRDAGPLGH